MCSCAHYKDIPYFQNSEEYDSSKETTPHELTIKPKDQLMIFVFSGSDQEAVSQFNIVEPRPLGYGYGEKSTGNDDKYILSRGTVRHRYLVDNEGNIEFPLLGKLHIADLTLHQVNDCIKEKIAPYLQPGADCVVNTYIENFEISVLGEVKKPNTFTIERPHVNVLEALAMAGDMTIYGKRNNVKILRELTDGTYEVHELDLRDANILNSPYYDLQQRDIVYVEPNEAMAQNAKIGETTRLWVRGASITISLGSLLYMVLQ